MSMSNNLKARLEHALCDQPAADEARAMIEAGANPVAAVVAAISSSNLVGVDGTGSNAAPLAGTETRLDALEAKINAILVSLKAAGLMAS